MRTGLTAWKLAKGLYIVPVLFAYTPFLYGDWSTALTIFAFALLALYAFAAAFQGWLAAPLGWLERLLLSAAALLMLWPGPLWLHGIGVLLFLLLYGFSRSKGKPTNERQQEARSPAP